MTSLRILHAVRSDGFAGVEQFIRRLAIAQAGAGHQVAVIGGAEDRMRSALEDAGVTFEPAARTAAVVAGIRRLAQDVEVINTHMTAADGAAAIALPRHGGPALVATRHFAQRRGTRIAGVFYRALERRIDAEVSISHSVATAIGTPSTVVFPGVDPVPDVDPRARHDTVLVAQRLQPEKRTMLALEAFAVSGLASDGWHLEIAGDGVEAVQLRTRARELKIDTAVRMLGFRSDLPALMSTAGLLMATAPFEHFGLTVLEAMSWGLPVVATDAAGHAEMLSGLDPRALFSPGDTDAAACQLRALAYDLDGRQALGQDERQRQRSRFTLRAQVASTDAVYRTAIGRHGNEGSGL